MKNKTNQANQVPDSPNKQQQEQENATATNSNNKIEVSGCYWMLIRRDTFALHLTMDNEQFTGKLSFNNFEKDKSSGSVHGKREGDVIMLWYIFQSEGMQNVMEVYFKVKGDQLVRGLGPVETRNDSVYFKDPAHLEYNVVETFERVDCSILPPKYM